LHVFARLERALLFPVAPAAARSSSAESIVALGALAPVVALPRLVIPVGAEIADRPLCPKAPTRSAPGTVVLIEGPTIPLEFRLIRPPATSTGCVAWIPEYARIDPTAPVGFANENV
jgi:hypothetical protein